MRRVVLAITSTVVGLVLLLSFKTHTVSAIATRPLVVIPTTAGTGVDPGVAADPTPTPTATATASSGAGTAAKTVTGAAADTRYGPVQVQITVKNGVITAAQAVDYPENSGRDAQINAYAIPVLNQEATKADSANIDMVSGATYTSEGYLQSLQSALNQIS